MQNVSQHPLALGPSPLAAAAAVVLRGDTDKGDDGCLGIDPVGDVLGVEAPDIDDLVVERNGGIAVAVDLVVVLGGGGGVVH